MRLPRLRSRFSLRSAAFLAGLLLFLCGGAACGNTGSEEMSFLTGEAVMNRMEALNALRVGVALNVSQCPDYTDAGRAAYYFQIGDILNSPHYSEGSVQTCQIALLATPCGQLAERPDFRLNIYRAVLTACDLRAVSPNP